MANKTFNTRVKNKRDTAANWEAVATTFQPLDGELIIVDTAAGKTRFKVGRYDTAKGRLLYYNEIPFTDEYLYNDLNESQGKIYDKLKGIDDKSIIEMTLEPSNGSSKVCVYHIGLWQFPKTGLYKIHLTQHDTTVDFFKVFARKTKDDGTLPEDFTQDNLVIQHLAMGDTQVNDLYIQVDYIDNDKLTVYNVRFLTLLQPYNAQVNVYDKTTQKWQFVSATYVQSAKSADRLVHQLTLTKGDTTTKFDGSTAQTVSIPTKTSELTNDSFVSYAEQTLTEGQQNQAKTNLGIDVLTGNTTTVTPTQVKEAILAGRPVAITYTDTTYGNLTFTSFGYSLENNVVVANLVATSNSQYILADLTGIINTNYWTLQTTELGTSTDIANNYVKYSESQTLTNEQKAQARTNIGAISSSDLVQADWNQNDETAKDYIKNRICYTKDATEITVLDSTLSFTKVSENVYSYQNTSSNIKFNEGTTYIVNFDTTSYTCIAFTNATLSNAVILGNLGVAGAPSATNEPFAMITDSKGDQGLQIVTNLTGASHNVKIAENHTEIVKLDKKYIPDDIFTDIKNIDNKVEDFINNTQFLAKTDSVGTGSFSFNRETDSTVGEKSATFGLNNVASGKYAFAEGAINKATNFASHAEGNSTIASGNVSHAEGLSTKAIGATSHSEGLDTVASGDYSHTEGEGTTAEGKWSHTEGKSTNTKGWASHAEGNETVAQGNVSHAEGRFTVALGENQHVEGILNIEDTTSLHIVGNGTYAEGSGQKTKSNAHTLDKLGNAWFAGDVYVGSTSGTNKDNGSKKLATEEYVDDQMTTINNQLGGLTGAMHFIGKAAVDITDGSTTDPQIANYTTKEKGDVILGKDDHKEFVWNGAIWEELGDEGSYALKTTTINGKALSGNITLTASNVGAASASTIETMQAAIDSKPSAADAVYTATAESTDGVAYTATVSGIDSLTVGASFIMIPNKASTSKAPTLNVNGLGAKPIRRRLSSLTTSLQQGYSTNWIALNKPFTVVYDGTAWVIEGLTKTDGADVYGAVAQATADANGNNIADTYATIAMLQSLLPKVTTITLTSNWVGDASPYYQDIALSCVTETSIVDLQPTPEQLNSWQDDGLAFTTLSGNGTVRVYVAGGKPSSAISVQVRVQEVTVI